MSEQITAQDTQVILQLLAQMRLEGLIELEYRGLKLRFSAIRAKDGTQTGTAVAWKNTLPKGE